MVVKFSEREKKTAWVSGAAWSGVTLNKSRMLQPSGLVHMLNQKEEAVTAFDVDSH